jgi:hypothetical protein
LAFQKRLAALIEMRDDPAKLEQWLDLRDSIHLLVDNSRSDDVILYLSAGHMFVHSVLVPSGSVAPPDFEDLSLWSGKRIEVSSTLRKVCLVVA